MRARSSVLAASAFCLFTSSWGAVPSAQDLQALVERSRCEQQSLGHISYAGDSSALGACLDRLADGAIAELRITSGGGAAWDTLRVVQKYAGRIDLLVVDGLCASSCANYVIPAARRLRVEPGSYVLLHGSPNLADVESQAASFREQFMRMSRETMPDATPEALDEMANATWTSLREEIVRMRPIQAEWASTRLACDDWLDPRQHLKEAAPPWMRWLLVTPEMAHRCLTATKVSGFWPPEAEAEFPRESGFVRARR